MSDITYNITVNAFSGSVVNIGAECCFKHCHITCSSETSGSGSGSYAPTFEELGLFIDLNPAVTSSLSLSGNNINSVTSCAVSTPTFTMDGTGHAPTYNTSSWGGGIPTFQFVDTNPSYDSYADTATSYFKVLNNTDLASVVNATTSSWTDMTLVTVFKQTTTSSKGQNIFGMQDAAYLNNYRFYYDDSSPTGFIFELINDTASVSSYVTTPLLDRNTNKHLALITISSGSAMLYMNNVAVTGSLVDVHPKTVSEFSIGASYNQPLYGNYYGNQMDGLIARFMIFDRALTNTELEYVTDRLNDLYTIY